MIIMKYITHGQKRHSTMFLTWNYNDLKNWIKYGHDDNIAKSI